jgi:hypothetical protein
MKSYAPLLVEGYGWKTTVTLEEGEELRENAQGITTDTPGEEPLKCWEVYSMYSRGRMQLTSGTSKDGKIPQLLLDYMEVRAGETRGM